MIKQDDKHGFIKHSNEKHSTIFINSPKLVKHQQVRIMRKQGRTTPFITIVTETVLVLQGGGLLGAYGMGAVYKTMAKHGIKFDILAGSSIGAYKFFDNLVQHADKRWSTGVGRLLAYSCRK